MSASAVVSAIQWIGSLLIQEGRPLFSVEEEVRGLKDELEFMQQYLQDADAKQEEGEINASVRQIRKLVYDAEDVIDTYILKVPQNRKSWVARFAIILYKFPRIYQVRKEIQVIQTSLKRVTDKLSSYGVKRDTGRQRPPSLPYDDIDGDYVVGLEKDISELLEILISEGKTQQNILSIVGMGGAGKTTLARKLYNHPYIRECFDCTAWVSISQEWSTPHVLSEILREIGSLEATPTTLGANTSEPELVDKLRNALKKKSYLVVLDDVWKREALEEILPALPRRNDHKGSKIIITTRNRDILLFPDLERSMFIHESKPLSDLEAWKLFFKIALSHGRHRNIESFENLGKEMLKKCDGLPLAIAALAGILNMKDNFADWQEVNEALRTMVMAGTGTHMYGRVGDMLALSYNDLPYSLKPCFLYLSLFPEDYLIPVGMLCRMWIAEGLVSEQGEFSVEDVAMHHLEELSHRFMVQVVRTNFKGKIKAVSLHDLLRDVGLKKAKELSFLQIYSPVSDPGLSNPPALSIQPRRTALHSSTSLPSQISNLRSLVLLTRSSIREPTLALNLIVVPQNFQLLRLLTLRGIGTVNGSLPPEIGNLLHLRYLEVRATNIVELPSTIGNLRYLLVLDYRDIYSTDNLPIKIPNVLWRLVQLRHLFLPLDSPWSVKELKLCTMRTLKTLWGVKQDAGGQWLSKEVSELSTTLTKLKIVVSAEDELNAAFSNPSLVSDRLQTFHCTLKSGIVLRNVEPLSHRTHLQKLILIGELDMRLLLLLPTNIVKLELNNSVLKEDDPMTALGALNHLKILNLLNAFVTTTLACKRDSFPQLEELYLESLQNLEKWKIYKGSMPRIKKLEIGRCWSLEEFPPNLKYVTTLQQLEFFEMPASFRITATKCGWSPQKLRLPHNCGAIIKRSDSPVDSSSIRKLYELLTVGIFLDGKKKKYWIAEQHGSYNNCFMVYSKDLEISRPTAVTYKKVKDRIEDGSVVTVAKFGGYELTLMGNFNTADLTPYVTYEICWLLMLEGSYSAFHLKVDEIDYNHCECTMGLARQGEKTQTQTRNLSQQPLDVWIQITGGEFMTNPAKNEELDCRLDYSQSDASFTLLIKGFTIQPKA